MATLEVRLNGSPRSLTFHQLASIFLKFVSLDKINAYCKPFIDSGFSPFNFSTSIAWCFILG